MIVRIEMFSEEGKSFQMLFGNNPAVRNWDGEFQQFLYAAVVWWDKAICQGREIFGLGKVEVSDADWVTFGGLKWCSHENFQNELNREGCQDWEPDNSDPRQYSEMIFFEDERARKKAYKMYKERIRHLPDEYTRRTNVNAK